MQLGWHSRDLSREKTVSCRMQQDVRDKTIFFLELPPRWEYPLSVKNNRNSFHIQLICDGGGLESGFRNFTRSRFRFLDDIINLARCSILLR